MPLLESLGLALVALGLWFWYDSIRARDAGIEAARLNCSELGLQFLDDTVVVRNLRLSRHEDGRLRIERIFSFEYSDTGDNRRAGRVTTLGSQVASVYAGPVLLREIDKNY